MDFLIYFNWNITIITTLTDTCLKIKMWINKHISGSVSMVMRKFRVLSVLPIDTIDKCSFLLCQLSALCRLKFFHRTVHSLTNQDSKLSIRVSLNKVIGIINYFLFICCVAYYYLKRNQRKL